MHSHSEEDEHDHEENDDPNHAEENADNWKSHLPLLSSLAIVLVMLVLKFGFKFKPMFSIDLIIYVIAHLLAGNNVLNLAFRKAKLFYFFNKFF